MLLDTQFSKYCHDVANSTCAREQRALLARGPPINVRDKYGFPECNDEEVLDLRLSHDKSHISPRLTGAVDGSERLKLWEELKRFIIVDEKLDDEKTNHPTTQ